MSTDSLYMKVYRDQLDNPPKKTKYNDAHLERTADGGYKIKTYYPSWDEMKDFSSYMKHIHETNGHKAGLVKIVPPNDYKPRKAGYDDESLYEMEITSPIRQQVTGEGGLYQQLNVVEKKKMSVRNFKRVSEEKHPTPLHSDAEGEMDRLFWKNIFTNPSMYGADVSGTLYDPDFEHFNLTKLNTILDNIQDDYGVTIEGVNTTYLYFGMWKSSFCWHTEDMDLYSINYLHTGAPKSWYCIAPEYGKRFERLANSFFPHNAKSCKAFLRHKTTLISPQILKKYSIPFSRCTQTAGEFMVTFPYSYHSGYNHGFNIAEATNFATEYWIDFGKWATRCECSTESVKISMQTFVKRYQSDRYEDWLRGRDVCKDPRDPQHGPAPAPKPTEHDLFLIGSHDRLESDPFQEEEEVKTKNALQQNLSSNLKSQPTSLKKKFDALQETYQRYSEYLMTQNNPIHMPDKLQLPHYSPIPTELIDTDQYVPLTTCVDLSVKIDDQPQYSRIVKCMKKSKSKKEEKLYEKKEKKANERRVLMRELLQFLPLTFTNEKKFNRCIAAQPPHCSICQILVPHPKDDEKIWGYEATPASKQTSESISESANVHMNEANTSLAVCPTTSIADEFILPDKSQILLPKVTFMLSEHKNTKEVHDSTKSKSEAETQDEHQSEPREGDSGYEDRIEFHDLNLDKPAELIQCCVCMLAVHRLCYGVEKMPERKNDWICDRCVEMNRSSIGCTLCPCRGGALKSINGVWVHITCAIVMDKVNHSDLISLDGKCREGFKLPEIVDKEKNNCVYCEKSTGLSKYVQGRCISCFGPDGRKSACELNYHPTCGHRNGVIFNVFDFHTDPYITQTIKATCHDCSRHYTINDIELYDQIVWDDLAPLTIGSKVIVWSQKRNMYCDGMIESRSTVTTYDIYFAETNEVELHVSERKIVGLDRSKDLRVGDLVRLKSTKGERVGKFRNKHINEWYNIRYDRASITERVSRGNIYLNIDQMSNEQIQEYFKNSRLATENNYAT